nr:hypothetical protein Iba_chr12fCG21340 [Ipomoea batatas]
MGIAALSLTVSGTGNSRLRLFRAPLEPCRERSRRRRAKCSLSFLLCHKRLAEPRKLPGYALLLIGAEIAGHLFLGVEIEEPRLNLDIRVVAEVGRVKDVLEVMDPLKTADLIVVSSYSNIAHPVGVLAPDAAHGGHLEEVWEVNIGGGVEVAADVVAAVGHAEFWEEIGGRVFAGAAVFGVGVEVEGIIAGLGKFSITDDFFAEMRVHRV